MKRRKRDHYHTLFEHTGDLPQEYFDFEDAQPEKELRPNVTDERFQTRFVIVYKCFSF